ncbi:MAG: hypothetical protein R6V10_02260 [bacterium]
MALADGDYLRAEEKAVEVVLADTDAGGLRESGSEAAATVSAGDEAIAKAFGQADFPAVLVRAAGKTESTAMPAYRLDKKFKLRFTVLHKSMDRNDAEEKVRKMASRLEKLLRDQTATDKQFMGLPDFIEGSEGILVSSVPETVFPDTAVEKEGLLARARLSAEVSVPCAFRYE